MRGTVMACRLVQTFPKTETKEEIVAFRVCTHCFLHGVFVFKDGRESDEVVYGRSALSFIEKHFCLPVVMQQLSLLRYMD